MADLKLATKTSIVLGGILALCLILLITGTAISANAKLQKAITAEFAGIVEENAVIVQGILYPATSEELSGQAQVLKGLVGKFQLMGV